MSKNTAVDILYRDAANYKQSRELIIEGEIPASVKEAIEKTYIDNEFVDLGKTTFGSLEGLFPDKVIDDELDHNFVTLDFRETTEAADMTIQDFAHIFGADVALEKEVEKKAPSPSPSRF